MFVTCNLGLHFQHFLPSQTAHTFTPQGQKEKKKEKSMTHGIYLVDVLAFSTVDMSLANASVTLLLALEVSSFDVVNSYNSGSTPYSIK